MRRQFEKFRTAKNRCGMITAVLSAILAAKLAITCLITGSGDAIAFALIYGLIVHAMLTDVRHLRECADTQRSA